MNKTLSQIPGYTGHVNDIGVSLWRGAYQIYGLDIKKTSGKVPVPLISADLVDLSIQWRELLRGAWVGEIETRRLVINFVKGRSKEESQTGVEEAAGAKTGEKFARHKEAADDWRVLVTQLFPLKINHFQISDGAIHFRDTSGEPKLDIYLDQVEAMAENLTNSQKVSKTLMANIKMSARAMKSGKLLLTLDMNPYSEEPAFDMSLALRSMDLTELNDLMRHYAHFDVRKGNADIFSEVVTSNGYIKGYVKPLIRDIDVIRLKDEKLSMETIRRVLIEWIAQLLENRKTQAVGTKVEFEGALDDPKSSLWATVKYAFRNAFIKALTDRLEESVSLKDIKHSNAVKQKAR